MKKTIVWLLAAMITLLLLPSAALAYPGETGTESGFSWKELDDGTVAVTGYSSSPGDNIVIPGTLSGKTVTVIDENAFSNDDRITGVEIPDTVTEIRYGAFRFCYQLVTVQLPASLVTIGNNAFDNCTALQTISFPDTLRTVGNDAFNYCISLNTVGFNDGLQTIGSSCFTRCDQLGDIVIPDSVTSIGSSAFYACLGLQSVKLSDGMTSLDESMFYGCEFLLAVTLPENLQTIGRNAFNNCRGLTELTVPETVTSIGQYAFKQCWSVDTITVLSRYASFIPGTFLDMALTDGIYGLSGSTAQTEAQAISKPFHLICEVSADPANGDPVRKSIVTAGDHFDEPEEPERTGYTFGGWFTDSDAEWVFDTDTVSADMTLTAKWTINRYPVTYETNGGDPIDATDAEYNSLLTPPAEPTRTGYTFDAWYSDEDLTEPWNFDTDLVTGDTMLYAGWTINRYTVRFITNSGGTIKDIQANYNTTITKPANPVRPGYTFSGWYRNSALTGSAWDFNSSKVTDNITLYAKWTANAKCAITALSGNTAFGTVSGSGSYTIGLNATVKALPKAGYRFVRWLEGSSTASSSAEYTFNVSKARTLKAEFALIGKPTISVSTAGYDRVKITWAAVAGAKEYEIYRSTSSSGSYVKVASATAVSYVNTGLTTGKTYYFKVRVKCVAGSVVTFGGYSTVRSAKPVLGVPSGLKAASFSKTSVKITWSALAGATKYEIYRATSRSGSYKKLGETAAVSFTSTGLTTGKTYYYKVRAYRLVGGVKMYGGYSVIVSAKPLR